MTDAHFRRAVILITEHDDQGTIGFILNKPIDIKIHSVLSNFPTFNSQLSYGGPVGQDTVHYIHNIGELLPGSESIMDGLFWTGDFDKLKQLIKDKAILEENILFFIGYSGWSVGQLEEELEEGSWIVVDASAQQILHGNYETMWKDVLSPLGDTFDIISEIPDSEIYN